MILDFTKATLPEGMTLDMLKDSGLQSFIGEFIANQKTVAVSEVQSKLDAAIQSKVISDQKVEDLRGQVTAAKKANPGDNKEHQAAVDALQTQLDAKNGEINKFKTSLDQADVRAYLSTQISAYNAANPALKIVSGAESYVLDAALATFKKNEAGQIIPFKGDEVLTGQSGYMTGAEFIASFRTDKPLFFEQPSGGGAAGNKGGGAGGDNGKYFDKSGDDFNLTKQSDLLKSNPDEYKKLKLKYAA